MSLSKLIAIATDKSNFSTIEAFIDFSRRYLEFAVEGLQAVIVSQNENRYSNPKSFAISKRNPVSGPDSYLNPFTGFTIKLNPLDGLYYCDIRPNMTTDPILKEHIQTIDYFFCSDLWKLIENNQT